MKLVAVILCTFLLAMSVYAPTTHAQSIHASEISIAAQPSDWQRHTRQGRANFTNPNNIMTIETTSNAGAYAYYRRDFTNLQRNTYYRFTADVHSTATIMPANLDGTGHQENLVGLFANLGTRQYSSFYSPTVGGWQRLDITFNTMNHTSVRIFLTHGMLIPNGNALARGTTQFQSISFEQMRVASNDNDWRILAVIQTETDIRMPADRGTPRHVRISMNDADISSAHNNFVAMEQSLNVMSDGMMNATVDIVQTNRPVTTALRTPIRFPQGAHVYVPSNTEAYNTARHYANLDDYDHLIVFMRLMCNSAVHSVPMAMGGNQTWAGINFPDHNGLGISFVQFSPRRSDDRFNPCDWHSGYFPDATLVHEVIHSLERISTSRGVNIPPTTIDNPATYGYPDARGTNNVERRRFYGDVMTGRVWHRGEYIGFTNETYRRSRLAHVNTIHQIHRTGGLAPVTGLSTNPQTGDITWNPVHNATGYDLFIGGTNITRISGGNTQTFNLRTLPTPLSVGTHNIQLRAVNANHTSPLSNTMAMRVTNRLVPLLQPPTNAQIDQTTGRLTWTAVEYATAYRIYIDNHHVGTATDTTFELSTLGLNAGIFDVQIVATSADPDRGDSPPSTAPTFIVRRTLAAPAITIDAITGVVSWQHVDGATEYHVYINATHRATITQTTFNLNRLQPRLTSAFYDISVRATSDATYLNDSAQSPVARFAAAAPLDVVTGLQLNPETQILAWDAVENAGRYFIYSDGQQVAYTWETQFPLTYLNLPPGTHRITVIATRDSTNYADSNPSQYVEFYVPTIYSIAAPTNVRIGINNNVLIWNTVPGAINYAIYINGTRVRTTDATQFRLTDLSIAQVGATLDIQVRTLDGQNNSPLSATVRHTVIEESSPRINIDMPLVGVWLVLCLISIGIGLALYFRSKYNKDVTKEN